MSHLARITWLDARGQVLGTAGSVYCAGWSGEGSRDEGYWPSRVYVCPHCADIWARELWQHPPGSGREDLPQWKVISRACTEHGGGELLDHLPLEVCDERIIIHEYLTLTKHWKLP